MRRLTRASSRLGAREVDSGRQASLRLAADVLDVMLDQDKIHLEKNERRDSNCIDRTSRYSVRSLAQSYFQRRNTEIQAVLQKRREVYFRYISAFIDLIESQGEKKQGYPEVSFTNQEKNSLFDTASIDAAFPPNFAFYIQKRIALDRASMEKETNPRAKATYKNAIDVRENFLRDLKAGKIATDGYTHK